MRRLSITHNDLAKPQNWLMTPEGDAAVIDFQLSSVHKRRSAFYCYLAYEDPTSHQTEAELCQRTDDTDQARILQRRGWPSSICLLTSKKI